MPKSIQSRYDVKVKVNIQSLIPTSFYISNVFIFLFLYFFDVNLRPKHTNIFSSVATTLELSSGSKHVIYQLESDEGLTTLHTRFCALCEAKFLIFDHMTTDQHRGLYRRSIKTDIPGITKAALFSVAINKQLNAMS